MTPFERAELYPQYFTVEHWLSKGLSQKDAELAVKHAKEDTSNIWMNDIYQVIVSDDMQGDKFPPLWHLSIKRRDKEVIHDWRDLQQIKNELIGPEHEGIELYPAESRLMDTANQYDCDGRRQRRGVGPFSWCTAQLRVRNSGARSTRGCARRSATRSVTCSPLKSGPYWLWKRSAPYSCTRARLSIFVSPIRCTRSNGGEGSLPTHCPGHRMSPVEDDEVMVGDLDFKDGLWRCTR